MVAETRRVEGEVVLVPQPTVLRPTLGLETIAGDPFRIGKRSVGSLRSRACGAKASLVSTT